MVALRQLGNSDLSLALRFVECYFALDGLEFNRSVEKAVEQLLNDESLGRFWGISAEGQDIGYLVLTFGFDHEFGGRIGLVTDFFLDEACRGQGYGREALRMALQKAKEIGLKAVELYVLDHNGRARAFYESIGFAAVEGRAPMSILL